MNLMQKLTILADGAKYDVACTSSGADRGGQKGAMGSALPAGCCHSFAADGRCISLLKVLMTNHCEYDCKYCVNRRSNDVRRTAFTPEELAELTIQFYRRNYIEGLFLSSGVIKNADYTMERMTDALELIRNKYCFRGYIHAKTIPGASRESIRRIGLLADRLSINIELPSERSLAVFAPDKTRSSILAPMTEAAKSIASSNMLSDGRVGGHGTGLSVYRENQRFAPAGQSTQMIIGASPERDYQIIRLAEGLYGKFALKRVFYSAYISTVSDSLLPSKDKAPPLLREHRLYQADFLMRSYGFAADEILSERSPDLSPYWDPKCNWALNNMWFFPVDVNAAPLRDLLRVPGIGPTSSRRIVAARRAGKLGIPELKKIGVVLKRARYFITARDSSEAFGMSRESAARALIDPRAEGFGLRQMSLFDAPDTDMPEVKYISSAGEAIEEAVLCLARKI